MPFEKGNKLAERKGLFGAALRRAIAQDDGKKLRAAAESLLDLAATGEAWAVKELADRLDGRAIQAVEVNDNRGIAELTTGEILTLIAAERATEAATGEGDASSVH